MQNKQATYKQYVLAGDRLAMNEQIAVSSHVFVENTGRQDSRDTFRAQKNVRIIRGISLKWVLVLFGIAVILAVIMVGNKISLTSKLHTEYALLCERLELAQKEYASLQEVFDQKSDASGICYYAVQSLGMRLASHEETIGIQAAFLPKTPVMVRGAASGAR